MHDGRPTGVRIEMPMVAETLALEDNLIEESRVVHRNRIRSCCRAAGGIAIFLSYFLFFFTDRRLATLDPFRSLSTPRILRLALYHRIWS